jgi:hypothetical protein
MDPFPSNLASPYHHLTRDDLAGAFSDEWLEDKSSINPEARYTDTGVSRFHF